MRVRPAVRRFAKEMESVLRQKDAQKDLGWRICNHLWLARRAQEEAVELIEAIALMKSPSNIRREAADVANFAMMVYDLTLACLGPQGKGRHDGDCCQGQ